jgi:hypothetical protein
MPLVESAACGIPVAAVNYSAMSDVVRNTKGFPIKVKRMFLELETGAYRAYPDNEYCAKVIQDFLLLSPDDKKKKQYAARKGAETFYNWDKTVKTWEALLDSITLTGLQGQWNTAPSQLYNIPQKMPTNLDNVEFMHWIYHNVICEPQNIFSVKALTMLQDLNYGATRNGSELMPFTQKMVFEHYRQLANNKLACEQIRSGQRDMIKHDYLSYAEKRQG